MIGFNPTAVLPQNFQPNWLSSCKLWLQGGKGIILNGSKVSAWMDQSGNNNNFTQVTPANQPNFVATGGANNQPAVQFVGSSSTFLENTTLNLSQPYTLIFVFLYAGGGSFTYWWGATSSNAITTTTPNNTTIDFWADTDVSVTVNNLTAASILQFDYNSPSSQLWQNGTSKGSGLNNGTHACSGNVFLGSNAGPTSFLTGTISEVLGFNALLTSSQRSEVTRYLGARYNMSVP